MRSNVLGHGDLRSPLDTKRLALLVRNAEYSQRVLYCALHHA